MLPLTYRMKSVQGACRARIADAFQCNKQRIKMAKKSRKTAIFSIANPSDKLARAHSRISLIAGNSGFPGLPGAKGKLHTLIRSDYALASAGDQGYNGAPGINGEKGESGPVGRPGLSGSKGEAGLHGAPGSQVRRHVAFCVVGVDRHFFVVINVFARFLQGDRGLDGVPGQKGER